MSCVASGIPSCLLGGSLGIFYLLNLSVFPVNFESSKAVSSQENSARDVHQHVAPGTEVVFNADVCEKCNLLVSFLLKNIRLFYVFPRH